MLPWIAVMTDTFGFLHILYMGFSIAVLDLNGQIVEREEDMPVWYIEYLLLLPRPETTQWN